MEHMLIHVVDNAFVVQCRKTSQNFLVHHDGDYSNENIKKFIGFFDNFTFEEMVFFCKMLKPIQKDRFLFDVFVKTNNI